ncbi:MAG: hypothetical protein E6H83_05775 [Chloroflexi bacterium]|nr:MAG: hypothetical protein E6H83_05775 [Chloroflexota bacterium]
MGFPASVGPGWHIVELQLNISAGLVEVWFDGAAVLTLNGVNMGTGTIGAMQIGDTAAVTWDVLFDDAAFGTSRLGVS